MCVQRQWAEQMSRDARDDGQPIRTPDGWLQWLCDNPGGRPPLSVSKHVVYVGDWVSDLSGETLASRCLLLGDGVPSLQLNSLSTLQSLNRDGGGWYHPRGGMDQYGYVMHLRWYDRIRDSWGQQRCGGGWFYEIASYGRALDGGPLRKTHWTKRSLRKLKIGKDPRTVVEYDPRGDADDESDADGESDGGEGDSGFESDSESDGDGESDAGGESNASGESDSESNADGGSETESDAGGESDSESDGGFSDTELREAEGSENGVVSALARILGSALGLR